MDTTARTRNNWTIVAAWAILMAFTALSWKLAGHGHLGLGVEASTIAVLALSIVKVLIVGHVFMDLRWAARTIRMVYAGWCTAICATLVVLYAV
ncbi:cytochrome C oxidase subunit IV family protein [Streptomyces chrestomyceticus]|uniref:cytochrome C oxidase subunit IV family protein n=1 Tax=Streptomyces chrestomyceticus TaxID=68185 RepID=UPI0033FC708A